MSTAEAYSVRHVTVDYRDRDPAAHPDPAAFDVALEEPLRDVASVSLRAWKVPLPLPASQGHRVLWLEAHDGRQVGARTSAPYRCPSDERAFLADLAAAAAAAGQDFAIASSRGAVTVSSSRAFAVLGGNPAAPRPGDAGGRWSVAGALGFPRGRFPASPAGPGFVAAAPHASTLHVPVDAYVRLRDAPCFEVPDAGTLTGPSGCLAVVCPDCSCLPAADPDRPVLAVGSDGGRSSAVVLRFHPPLSRVRRLRVSVVDYYGDVINTDNRDVRLDFVFRTSPANASSPCGFPINNPR